MRTILSAVFGVALFAVILVGCQPGETPEVANGLEPVELDSARLVQKGAYLVEVMGCHDCHSPKKMTEKGPVPDETRLLMGHPADLPVAEVTPDMIQPGPWIRMSDQGTIAVGPWGVSFAGNITSDPTGIGTWTEEQFFRALREGLYKGLEGSRPLMPLMPWQAYGKMKDEDLRAIFYYLKTTKPIQNVVPAYISPDQLASK